MKWTDVRLRLRGLLFRNRVEDELQEELDFHLQMQVRKNRSRGMGAADAKRQALTKFGGVQKVADECRDERRLNLIDSWIQDVRYAQRQFRRSPVFTLVAVVSLGLGIGANTALFTVFDTLYLRTVPVPQPDDLVSFRWRAFGESNPLVPTRVFGSMLSTSDGDTGVEYTESTSFLPASFEAFRAASAVPAEVFAFAPFQASADIRGWPHDTSAQLISGNYFSALGVPAIAGRPLGPSDDDPSAEPAVVISHFAWQSLFGGEMSAIGEQITLNGLTATIVGVAPPGFYLAGGVLPGFSIPMAFAPRVSQGALGQPGLWWLRLMARKRTEATVGQVEGSLQGLFQGTMLREAAISSSAPKEQVPRLESLAGSRGFVEIAGIGRQEDLLIIVWVVFGLLLFIVCLNLANLLTARSVAREYEIAMRLAMGASRRRLIRQLLTESLMLAIAGGAAGVALAYWGKELLRSYFGEQLPLSINLRVLVFSIAVAATTGVLFGLVPALRATRSSLNDAAKRNARNAAPRVRLNKSLVVVQVAMSVALLIGAGLLVRTLGNWQRLDFGFDIDGLVVFDVPGVGEEKEQTDFYDRLAERINAVPGVTSVTTAGCFPPSSCGNEVRANDATGDARSVQVRRLIVGPSFFEALGISVLAGRNVDHHDVPGAPPVAVVDEALARQLFPNSNPIGKRFGFGREPNAREFEIVGIVPNIVIDIGRSQIRPNYYTAESQTPATFGRSFIVRVAGDTQTVIPAIRRAVAGVDPGLPLFGITTFRQLIQKNLTRHRQLSLTWILFGGSALFLTAIGLYGLMSYTVSRRVNEIGIRMALGATRLHVSVLVLRQMLVLVLIGLCAGFALSLGVNQLLWAFVFGVRVVDLWILLWVGAAVCAVTGLASYMPARRASRVDPMLALRSE